MSYNNNNKIFNFNLNKFNIVQNNTGICTIETNVIMQIISQFALSLDANPNNNYSILSSTLEQAKNLHIPKQNQRLNRSFHFIH